MSKINLLPLIAYSDASGSAGESHAVVVASLVSTPEKWITFQAEWQDCLAAHGVSALHMKDFAHSKRQFASWGGDEPKRRRFINGLLWAIERNVEHISASAVLMSDYEEFDGKYQLSNFMRPYTLACLMSASLVVRWAERAGHRREQICYVFEKGDEDQDDLKSYWSRAYPELRVIEPIFKKKTDRYPESSVITPIRPFEAADFIAYENYKANAPLLEQPAGLIDFAELRKPIQRMRWLPGAEDWCIANKDSLEVLCRDCKIPLR